MPEATLKMVLKTKPTAAELIEFLQRVPDNAEIRITEDKTFNQFEHEPATITASWREE